MKTALAAMLLLAPVQDEAMKVTDVIAWMTKETKKKFAFDEVVATAYGTKRVTLTGDGLDAARAYEIGLTMLRTAGLAALPLEDGSVRLVPDATAAREQVKVYSNAADLPKADEFCTLTIQLKNVDVRQAHAALINVCRPQSIVPVESARVILATDYASNLRKVVEIVKKIDVAGAKTTYRVSVAVLDASNGEASVPEAFKTVDFSGVTNRNRFTIAGEAFARVELEPKAVIPQPKQPAGDVALRFAGAHPLLVEFAGTLHGEKGPMLERFTVRDDKDQSQAGPRLLETRVELREGEWIVVGSVPGEKDGTSLVVLARAVAAK